MKIWLVLLISIIPTIVIALLAYFMLKSHTEKELKEQVLTLKREGRKTINPIRLQAYERKFVVTGCLHQFYGFAI